MISIIVPVYGVEKYLRQCIESIVSQSYTDIEIILVDDGSPDNCPKICDEYAETDSRVKVIHKQNGGLVSARQAGLEAANGEYIGFVDGDDRICPDMYETMADAVLKYSPDMVVSEFYCDFENRTESSSQCFSEGFYDKIGLLKEIYPVMLYSGSFYRFGITPNCWSKLFKAELLKKYLPNVDKRIKMGEDAAFTYPCLLNADSLYCIKKPLYRYRILNTSMSRGYDDKLENIIYLPYEAIRSANDKSNFDMSAQIAYYHIYLANFVIRNEAKSNKKDSGFVKRILNDDELKKNAYSVSDDGLPKHTALIVHAIRKKSVFLLNMYIRFMGIYLKRVKK